MGSAGLVDQKAALRGAPLGLMLRGRGHVAVAPRPCPSSGRPPHGPLGGEFGLFTRRLVSRFSSSPGQGIPPRPQTVQGFRTVFLSEGSPHIKCKCISNK